MRPWPVFLLAVLCASPLARADDAERRLSVVATGGIMSMEAGGADTTQFGAGGRVRVARGVTNAFEVGAIVGLDAARAVEFPHATVAGDQGNLFVDVYGSEVAVDARWILGIDVAHAFWLTHPILGLRAGVRGEWLRDAQLFDDRTTDEYILLDSPDDDFRVLPFAGVELGAERRFGRAFSLGLIAGADRDIDGRVRAGIAIEASWHSY